MAESTGFQHITVVPADEEEIVIQAGASRASRPAPAPVAEPVAEPAPVAVPAPEPAPAPEPVAVAEPVSAPAPEITPEDAKAEAQLAHLESSSGNFTRALHEAIAEERVGKPAREAYRETTLEDLQGTPMSPMQKIILFVLLGFLVVFGVYCLLRFGLHLF